MYVLDAARMRAVDARATGELGLTVAALMERAGEGLAGHVRAHFEAPRGERVWVLCGRGHNGGDGMVAARHLRKTGSRVSVLLVGARARDLKGAPRACWSRLKTLKVPCFEAPEAASVAKFAARLGEADLIVDALLGTGARGPLEGAMRAACDAIRAAGAPVVSADLPTGVDATTGECQPEAVKARLTVTFAFPKLGHLLQPGRSRCGTLEIVDIGIPESLLSAEDRRFEVLTPQAVSALLPRRPPSAAKGDVGRVRIVGGAPGMLGAPALAARAALRAGTGLVSVSIPRALYPALAPLLLEATATLYDGSDAHSHTYLALEAHLRDLESTDALALGPGLSRQREAAQLAALLVRRARLPIVLDADGLNAFEGHAETLAQRTCPLVLTPHAGELARLARMSREEVERARLSLPSECAGAWNAVVLLKGSPTVVSDPAGRTRLNPTGNAGMATAGSGDVLTGIVASLLGRGLSPFDAASVAAYVHGFAGDLAREAVGEESLVASDLLLYLPEALKTLHGLAAARPGTGKEAE